MAIDLENSNSSETNFTEDISSSRYSPAVKTGEYRSDVGKASDVDSADDVDPRKLYEDSTLNEIRWYYRNTIAKKIVDKPIDDAFKNGFKVHTSPEQNASEIKKFFENTDFITNYRLAQKKARRDGFALLYYITEGEGQDQVEREPVAEEINDIVATKVLTIDHLYGGKPAKVREQIAEQVGRDEEDFTVRRTGMVIDKDIQSETFNEPLGYVIHAGEPQFVHRDRVQHFVWNPEVDGNYRFAHPSKSGARTETLGRWEGDSVLQPSLHLLKSLTKSNWAIGQTLFRYSSKLHVVSLPEDADQKELNKAEEKMRNVNSKSEIIVPHGYEIDDFGTDGQLDPRNYFDVIFEQICAGQETTKSVLFGTQTGVVSGSEVDIKNYFNKVERFQKTEATKDLKDALKKAYDWGVISETAYQTCELEWNEIFELPEMEQAEKFRTLANAVTMLINMGIMTPNEAREIVNDELEYIDLDKLAEEQIEFLVQLGIEQGEVEAMGNPQQQNGGGMPEGETTAEPEMVADIKSTNGEDTVIEFTQGANYE